MFRCPLRLTRDDFLQNGIGTEFMMMFDAIEPDNASPCWRPHHHNRYRYRSYALDTEAIMEFSITIGE